MGFIRRLQVVNNARICQVQRAGCRIDAIPFFGDGQRDNRHLRFTEFFDNGRQRIQRGIQAFFDGADNGGERIELRIQAFVDGTDDNCLIAVCALFQHGV